MLIGHSGGGMGYTCWLGLLLAAPATLLFGLAAFGGDLTGVPTPMDWLLRTGSAMLIPASAFAGVWIGRRAT